MNRVSAIAACFTALGVLAASLQPAWPAPKDQSRIGGGNSTPIPDPGPGHEKSDFEGSDEGKADFRGVEEPDLTMPSDRLGGYATQDIETESLTVDAARRALDAFAEVRDKYTGEGLEDYNSLEEFVSQTEAGKRLEADIMAHGFSDITDWNETITAVGSAYSAIIYDYASDLRQQIEAVRNDPNLDEAMRARLVAGLTALMPSRNNRIVLQALLEDPIYRNKLKLLQEEE